MAKESDPQTLTILGYEDDSQSRSSFSQRIVRKTINVEELEAEVQKFFEAMDRIIGNLQRKVGEYQLDSVTVSAEVNAKGKVSLLGSGGEMGGKGGMSFTFRRSA